MLRLGGPSHNEFELTLDRRGALKEGAVRVRLNGRDLPIKDLAPPFGQAPRLKAGIRSDFLSVSIPNIEVLGEHAMFEVAIAAKPVYRRRVRYSAGLYRDCWVPPRGEPAPTPATTPVAAPSTAASTGPTSQPSTSTPGVFGCSYSKG